MVVVLHTGKMAPTELIVGLIISVAAIALSITGFAFSGYGSTHRPSVPAALECEELNLTLDGAVLGIINQTILAELTANIQCAPNEALLGGTRYETGLWLDGACALIPSGNTTLSEINPALVACAGEELLVLAQLWERGLGINGSCITPLLQTTVFGGDVSGLYNNLLLNNVVPAASCGMSDSICDLAINAKGLVVFSASGATILFANATAGGGATGPIGNLTLSLQSTTNQTTLIQYANGTAQLGTVQDICLACSPSFAAMTLTGTPLAASSGGTGSSTSPPPVGHVLIGNTATSAYVPTAIAGTPDQVTVNLGVGTITLVGPQNLATTSSPSFAAVVLSTPLSTLNGGTGVAGTPASGQFLIGNNVGFSLAGITGTANQVIVTPGVGSSTLSLPQSLATTSTPTFQRATLTNALAIASGGLGTATGPTNGQLAIGTGAAYALAAIAGTASQISIGLGSGTTTLNLMQNLGTATSPTFAALTLGTPLSAANGGTGLSTTPLDGRLLIGNAPGFSLNTMSGTASQISIATGAGLTQITLTDTITAGTCGGDGKLCVYTVSAHGRILSYTNETVVTSTTFSGTTTGCYARAYTFTLQKTFFSSTFAAIDLRLTQTAAGSTNAANCAITFDANIPAGYRPLSTMPFCISVRGPSGVSHAVMMTITSAGVVTINAVKDFSGVPLMIPAFGFPANFADFNVGDINLSYFTFAP